MRTVVVVVAATTATLTSAVEILVRCTIHVRRAKKYHRWFERFKVRSTQNMHSWDENAPMVEPSVCFSSSLWSSVYIMVFVALVLGTCGVNNYKPWAIFEG